MNTGVMKQWLYAFYQHIGTERRVVLLMDNFSAHSSAIEEMPPLANIRIAWLPLNATSRYQPLDQGIIQSFKAHYRRQWLSYMLDEYEHGRNPINTMTLAWRFDGHSEAGISMSTAQRSQIAFVKAQF
jgi:hypothetical protein